MSRPVRINAFCPRLIPELWNNPYDGCSSDLLNFERSNDPIVESVNHKGKEQASEYPKG
jgi:hypothetical protein